MKKKITMIEGKCQGGHHVVGDSWVVEKVTPKGICIHAWNSLSTYLLHLDMDGEFWGDEPHKFKVHCPDLKNGVLLEIEKIPEGH